MNARESLITTVDEIAISTEFAIAARASEEADTDALTNRPPLDARAKGIDPPDHFVPRDARPASWKGAFHRGGIRVADTGRLDANAAHDRGQDRPAVSSRLRILPVSLLELLYTVRSYRLSMFRSDVERRHKTISNRSSAIPICGCRYERKYAGRAHRRARIAGCCTSRARDVVGAGSTGSIRLCSGRAPSAGIRGAPSNTEIAILANS
jgi:hypothetical protein